MRTRIGAIEAMTFEFNGNGGKNLTNLSLTTPRTDSDRIIAE